MKTQTPKEKEVLELLDHKMREAIDSMIEESVENMEKVFGRELDGLSFLEINRIKRKWWQFWKPQFTYPELESDVEIKVNVGTSLPVNNDTYGNLKRSK